jgi:hypothetical protein
LKPGWLRWAAVAALAVALLLALRWWRSDERRIHAAFDGMLAAAEKSGEESQLDRLGHARRFAEVFAFEFVVSAQPYSGTITDRQQLMGILDAYRSASRTVTARGVDRELTVRDNGTADLFAVIDLDGSAGGGPGRERFRARFSWVRENGEWRISEAEILERLERSGIFD